MKLARTRRTIATVVGAACLLAAIGVAANGFLRRHGPTIPDVAAALGLKPRTVELPVERAARARSAILKGDFATARTIIMAELAHSKIERWRFHPFRDFINDVSDVGDPEYGERVRAWAKAGQADTLPLLVLAQYEYDIAWAQRGTNFDRQTRPSDLDFFDEHMAQANTDIDAALAGNDANPYYFALKLRILYSLGAQQAMRAAFENAIAKYPSYYPLYSIALATLQPKWGGSVQAMKQFVETYAGQANATSPLKMLYVELYESFVTMSSENCSGGNLNEDGMKDCVAASMRQLGASGFESGVLAALNLYRTSDKYQYNIEAASLLDPMILTPGAESYSGALLQLAATATESDTQLVEDKAKHPNDYVIDFLAGLSWGARNDVADAMQKYEEALRDISFAGFPDEAARDQAYAAIFEALAGGYNKLHQYEKEIAYESAAVAYGGPSAYQHLICNAYIQMQSYQAAADACTPFIDGPDGIESRYWRAAAYHYLNQPEAEAADLQVIADSENPTFRTPALIKLSVYYATRKEFRAMIDLLDAHPFAFDVESQRKDDLAVVYNNRCYAYMQLGDLRKALDDCTASLRFGSIPDAYHKQQELVRRLNAVAKP